MDWSEWDQSEDLIRPDPVGNVNGFFLDCQSEGRQIGDIFERVDDGDISDGFTQYSRVERCSLMVPDVIESSSLDSNSIIVRLVV